MGMKGLYTYGMWLPQMDAVVRPLVQGHTAYDFGAGTLGHSFRLLELGASSVVAVDKNPFNPSLHHGYPIQALGRIRFHQVVVPPGGIKVALLAFPDNHPLDGLIPLLKRCETVIYLGSNVGGTACGWPALWDYLHFREIVGHVPHPKNSLIAYGRHLEASERRPLKGEELAACSGIVLSFSDAERTANRAATIVGGSSGDGR
jgi:hypothetical protein